MPQSLLSRIRSESKTPEYRRRFPIKLADKTLGLVAVEIFMASASMIFGAHAYKAA